MGNKQYPIKNPIPTKIERNFECVARDGVILRSDVYHPDEKSKFPVLVCRTPYNKLTDRYVKTARDLASRGYCVVVQDFRGRYASDGEYLWMWRERTETFDALDGFDTIEWASTLPWSDGRVGTWGHSNASWAVWMTLDSVPPHLCSALASGISKNILDINFGIFETGRRLEWTYMMAADMRKRLGKNDGPTDPVSATEIWHQIERGKYIWWLPLSKIPESVFGPINSQLQTYHRNQNVEFQHFDDIHSKVNCPVFQITGWWDRLIGTLDNFHGLIVNGKRHLVNRHRIVVGPWGHDATQFTRKIGPIDYGYEAESSYAELIARWYDSEFKKINNGLNEEKPVQLFILGDNKWRGEDKWPIPRTKYIDFYLGSLGNANTLNGDGFLSTTNQSLPNEDLVITDERSAIQFEYDSFLYDPRDPVMSLMRADSQAAPVDQKPHDHRMDILFYETPVFQKRVEFTGPVELFLWASTDGHDTDWTAKISIVHEDNLAINLTYGIQRAIYRDGFNNPSLIEPNKPYLYKLKINPIGCVFLPGQKLRLCVSSSDFPNFDRNHNTGKPYWKDNDMRTASQKIFHSKKMPSRLVLPWIPNESQIN
jgi:putative CocE/NonD family hydrolase|tara:strand:- start:250 stop:2037 length:1788 start_codon:yes stop_codon:yes gene_type:complete